MDSTYLSLKRHLPTASLNYAYELWQNHPFIFKLRKDRVSKLGDYRYHIKEQAHVITINEGLNSFSFLITYLHEVAHALVYKKHKRSVAPHGKEWKEEFQQLMYPMLNPSVFPEDILRPLAQYMRNPKASSTTDHHLFRALKGHDHNERDRHSLVMEYDLGDYFKFRKKIYQLQAFKRTRALATEISTGKKYLFSKIAEVENYDPC